MTKIPQELLNKQYKCTGCGVEDAGELFLWYFSKKRNCYCRKPKCRECTRAYDSWRRNTSPDLRPKYLEGVKRYWDSLREKDPVKYRIKCNMGGYRKRSRKEKVPYNITVEYLIALHHKQQGKCYYTGKDFAPVTGLTKKSSQSMTLDRLTPSLGYVVGNVVWCLDRANTAKSNLVEEEFYQFCKHVLAVKGSRKPKDS